MGSFGSAMAKERQGGRSHRIASNGSAELGFLGFLYPRKTLAYMDKLSEQRLDSIARNSGRSAISIIARPFSSKSGVLDNYPASEPGYRTAEAYFPKNVKRSGDSHGHRFLKKFVDLANMPLDLDTTGAALDPPQQAFADLVNGKIPLLADDAAFETAWRLYSALDPLRVSQDEKMQLLNYLSFSSRHVDRVRTGFLASDPTLDGYPFWKLIISHLGSGQLEAAVGVHDRAIYEGGTSYIGSDVLLANAIRTRRWDLALQVSATVIGNIGDRERVQRTIFDLWKMSMRLPDLSRFAVQYLDYAYDRLDVKFNVVNIFVDHFVSAALSQFPEPDISSDLLLETLHKYELDKPYVFETAIKRLIGSYRTDKKQHDVRKRTLLHQLWKSYHRSCQQGKMELQLMLDLLRCLAAFRVSHLASEVEEDRMIKEIESECFLILGKKPLPYGIQVALIRMYSWRGNVKEVQELNSKLLPNIQELFGINRSQVQQTQDVRRVCALIRVHAIRGDLESAEKQFYDLREEYRNRHRAVWIELLHVYAKSYDIGKAFDCVFNRMPAVGMLPDRETLLVLLTLCGWSGDLEAVTALLKIAKEQNIELETTQFYSLVLAHLKNNDGKAAEELAQMLTESRTEPAVKKSLTPIWNAILHRAGIARDLDSVERISVLMQEQKIAINRYTYLAIVKMLVYLGQTDRAAHVVKTVMPQNGFPPDEVFYSLLVRGYSYEKLFATAVHEFEEMMDLGMKPTSIARANLLFSKAMLGRTDPQKDEKIITELEEAINTPERNRWHSTKPLWSDSASDQYLEVLIDRFSEVGDEKMVSNLLGVYTRHQAKLALGRHPSQQPKPQSLGVLRSLMKAFIELGKHDLVLSYWTQSLSLISQLRQHWQTNVALVDKSLALESSKNPSTDSHPTASGRGKFTLDFPASPNTDVVSHATSTEASWKVRDSKDIPMNISHLLSRPLMLYMRSLIAQKQYDTLISTVESLTSTGFVLDRRAWNQYVLHLCESPSPHHVIAAFQGCEKNLIANFQPWQYMRKEQRSIFNVERKKLNWVGHLHPEHRTLFVLKSIGHGPMGREMTVAPREHCIPGQGEMSLLRALQRLTPDTMKALESWVPLRPGSEKYMIPLWVQTKDAAKCKRLATVKRQAKALARG